MAIRSHLAFHTCTASVLVATPHTPYLCFNSLAGINGCIAHFFFGLSRFEESIMLVRLLHRFQLPQTLRIEQPAVADTFETGDPSGTTGTAEIVSQCRK